MALHIALAFPVVLHPCKLSLLDLIRRARSSAHAEVSPHTSERSTRGRLLGSAPSSYEEMQYAASDGRVGPAVAVESRGKAAFGTARYSQHSDAFAAIEQPFGGTDSTFCGSI